MIRTILFAVPLLFVTLTAQAADEAKGEKVEFTTYADYFEKNDSGLKGDSSYLVFVNKEGFNKVFSLRPPLMGGAKPVAPPDNTFEKKLVIAAIKRGNAITTYNVEKVTVDGDTLFIQYKATAGNASTATFASPLIATANKGKVKKVVFIENEKTVGTVEVK